MKTHEFRVERIEAASRRSFAATVAAFEEKIPAADVSLFVQLINANASAAHVEQAVQNMAGDLGFMRFAKIDQGPLVSQLGKSKKMSVYLMGNPVLANRMYEQNPAVGLYAPLRVAIYEDYQGVTHFTYDRPSSLLAQFQDDKIRAVAQLLDEKMGALTAYRAENARE